MKYTMGIRMALNKEILGSDEVEHNISEFVLKVETNHTVHLKDSSTLDTTLN